jgi:gamma-glutamyltranspeptidase/glutathione hydrolase
MCPTVVCRAGRPVLALGATGGRRIPNTLCDVLTYRIGAGQTLEEAVRGPRLHTEGDTRLTLEARWPAAVVKHLQEVGYVVKTGLGATLNATERDAAGETWRSAAR